MKLIRPTNAVILFVAICLAAGCAERSANTPMELSTFAGWQGAAPKADDSFTFAIVSDRTGSHAPGRWIYAVERINGLAPDFVMSVGDAIEGYTEDANELEAQWDEFDSITSNLDSPFFYVPGNHDVSNDVMLKTFIDRHGVDGKSYYRFNYRGRHFVILDTNTAKLHAESAAEQVAWLEKDIAAVIERLWGKATGDRKMTYNEKYKRQMKKAIFSMTRNEWEKLQNE